MYCPVLLILPYEVVLGSRECLHQLLIGLLRPLYQHLPLSKISFAIIAHKKDAVKTAVNSGSVIENDFDSR